MVWRLTSLCLWCLDPGFWATLRTWDAHPSTVPRVEARAHTTAAVARRGPRAAELRPKPLPQMHEEIWPTYWRAGGGARRGAGGV